MNKKAHIDSSKNRKIFYPSLGLKGKGFSKKDKKEEKTYSLSLTFFRNENAPNLRSGIITEEMTIITNRGLDINNFSFSFFSFNEYIPEEGNEEEAINNFNIDNYSINRISRK